MVSLPWKHREMKKIVEKTEQQQATIVPQAEEVAKLVTDLRDLAGGLRDVANDFSQPPEIE